jgi:hypothetical protein
MRQISRDEAEKLFLGSSVINTEIKQDNHELRVIITLSSRQSCHVTYNFESREKTYQLEDITVLNSNPSSP